MRKGSGLLRFLGLVAVALAMTIVFTACGAEKKSDSGQPAAGGNSAATADACKIVTQEDATKLFGKPAIQMTEGTQLEASMAKSCNWTWDTDTQNQLLQFSIWNGEQYYDANLIEAQPIDIGDKGLIRISGMVTIQWLQNGKTINLAYSTTDLTPGGREIPQASAKVEEVKQLAKKVEGEL